MSDDLDVDPNSLRGPTVTMIPDGDDRERKVCPDCGFVAYENPKLIVGAVVTYQDRFLLCRRAIAPRIGYWTIPAGFMELDESIAQGAARETWEEAGARVDIEELLGIYEIPRIGQIYMVYKGSLAKPEFAPGTESQEVALFTWDEIPWDSLAFPSVRWALTLYREGRSTPAIHTADPGL